MQRKIGIDIHRLDNRIRRCVCRAVAQHEIEAVSGSNGRIIRFLSEHADGTSTKRIWRRRSASPVPRPRGFCG